MIVIRLETSLGDYVDTVTQAIMFVRDGGYMGYAPIDPFDEDTKPKRPVYRLYS